MTETVESKKEKTPEQPANGGASDDLKETEESCEMSDNNIGASDVEKAPRDLREAMKVTLKS